MPEEKNPTEEESKLEPLTSIEGGESYTGLHEVQNPNCKHYFIFVAEGMIQCKECQIGYQLSSGDRLFNGHLYFKDEMVI